MHIKEIILDGFKSYGRRTIAGPFDREFNAITGLNGSGKSNILDSICFVLGISKLAQVRVANMQGLVYKNGQAGVTKASVTIVFDNNAPGGPLGYDQHKQITVTRQVVIGGRNKYLINGRVAQQKQVQDLFHSVQLNVNNPHFLIMQGRITKVLNMNPDETLGLVEEAAGTRMYEDRKASSQKRMAKKEEKVKEIQRVLREQITPQMEKLDGQRKHYQDWSAVNSELERLMRFVTAFSYQTAVSKIEYADEGKKALEEKVQAQRGKYEATGKEIEKTKASVSELMRKKEDVAGDNMRALQDEESSVSKLLVQENTQMQNAAKSVKAEDKALKQLEQKLAASKASVAASSETIAAAEQKVTDAKAVVAREEEQLGLAERSLQALAAGMQESQGASDDIDGSLSMEQQLRAAEATVTKTTTVVKMGAKKRKMLEKALKAAQKNLSKEKKTGDKLIKSLAEKQAEVTRLTQAMGGEHSFDEAEESRLHDAVQQLESRVAKLDEDYNSASSRLSSRLRFDFATPSKNFDRSSVKGVVANLLTVKDASASTALEVAAGGKLFGVVVDTAQNAKSVLKRGKLKRRVTIIPLDKMRRRTLPEERMAAAEKLYTGPKEVRTALSLVGYAEELEGAMQHVFGSTLVCKTLDIAKAVTFHKRVKLRSVTLEGDAVDPAGTMSGGSRGRQAPVLFQLAAVTEIRNKLEATRTELNANRSKLDGMAGARAAYEKHADAFEMATHALKIMQESIANSKHGMLAARVKECEDNMRACNEEMEAATQAKNDAVAQINDLKKAMAELEAEREAKMAGAEAAIKKHKAATKKATKALGKAEGEYDKVLLELKQLKVDCEALEVQCNSKKEEVVTRRAEVAALKDAVDARKQEYAKVAGALRAQKEEMAKCEAELRGLLKLQAKLERKHEKEATDLKKYEAKICKHEEELAALNEELASLVDSNSWIESEKQFFGARGTDYDFSGRDLASARLQLAKLEEQATEMEKTINRKVMGMIQKAETEYQGLKRKQKMLENDRQKIEDVIKKLDDQKKEALEKTWSKVTKDFGSIFSTLLPGANAKLQKVSDSIIDGIEVKVSFSGVWKESLSELSGGQRSLVALSLILALLLFKPAPMYILDEVDAALDLSHTQNIGRMLKQHFKNSQFIVVSLKEGMFNNANVIFRTKFIDGMSTVRRTVPASAAVQDQEEISEVGSESAVRGKGKKRARKGNKKPLANAN
eukprot:g3763.t1